jgi:hypothetical protein
MKDHQASFFNIKEYACYFYLNPNAVKPVLRGHLKRGSIYMRFSMTGQNCFFNTGDCLIEVTPGHGQL